MEINWEQLQEFKNHYRGLASWQNWRLVRIRVFLENLEAKSGTTISQENWDTLMDLAKAELYKTPPRGAVEVAEILEDHR